MSRPIHEIAADIQRDIRQQGKPVPYAAKPYLQAMAMLSSIEDSYYADSGRSIVAYFLSNASSYRGERAKALKAELKAL